MWLPFLFRQSTAGAKAGAAASRAEDRDTASMNALDSGLAIAPSNRRRAFSSSLLTSVSPASHRAFRFVSAD
jgi:hypothetical protein